MVEPKIEKKIEPTPLDALVGLLSFEFNGLELELIGLIARVLG